MYAKYLFWKVFKKSYKTMKEFISKNFAHFVLTQRALKGQSRDTQRALERLSKGTWTLSALQALQGHSRTQGTCALGNLRHSGIRRALGHSKNLDTWTLNFRVWRPATSLKRDSNTGFSCFLTNFSKITLRKLLIFCQRTFIIFVFENGEIMRPTFL